MSNRKDGWVDGNKGKPDTVGDFTEMEAVAAGAIQSGMMRGHTTWVLHELCGGEEQGILNKDLTW